MAIIYNMDELDAVSKFFKNNGWNVSSWTTGEWGWKGSVCNISRFCRRGFEYMLYVSEDGCLSIAKGVKMKDFVDDQSRPISVFEGQLVDPDLFDNLKEALDKL